MYYDVFNGDADGLCALHQWRLAHPVASTRITGVKRDVRLLERVTASPGDVVTVFDISLRDNRDAARQVLDRGARLIYFDHHESDELPATPAAELHLSQAPDTCTSLLVDRALKGAFRAWAVVAAFGDNLDAPARQSAAPLGLPAHELDALAELGRLLNYNAYGDTLADLHFRPDKLYEAIHPYVDPLRCAREAPEVATLREGLAEDLAHTERLQPILSAAGALAFRLPAAPWARRVHGTLANRLVAEHPERAIAVLVDNADSTVRISVRAPRSRPSGADALCRPFPTGGGRALAAGISRLPPDQVETFLSRFAEVFGA
jgi:hypothetical protein